MAQKVHVVTGYPDAIKKCLQDIPQDIPCSWIYLGKNVTKCAHVEKILGNRIQRIGISDTLQKYARMYRQEYIDYIGKLSKECDNPLWPLTTLAEKNPFVSEFFLSFCYVKTVLNFIQERPENIIIVCETRGVFDALRDNLPSRTEGKIRFLDPVTARLKDHVLMSIIRSRNKLVFFTRYLLRIFLARVFSWIKGHSAPAGTMEPAVVMHSWADSRSFNKKHDYLEIYLGNLGSDIEKDTPNFLYLVHVLPTLWYGRALLSLMSVNKRIYLVEEFLTAGDLIRSYVHISHHYPRFPMTRMMGGLNVSAFIAQDYRADKNSSRLEQIYLNYFISHALSDRFDVRSFIYPFENHIWEKAFCMGFMNRKETRTIGYAIVFINRMYTCYSVSQYEKESTYLPDYIFVSGSQGKKMLAEAGFDDGKIFVGGAIRYPGIRRYESKKNGAVQNNILVILGPSVSQSLEILLSVIEAFRDTNEVNVIIKCHPIVPLRSLSPYLSNLPSNFRIADRPVEELLGFSGLVVYADSTVCVEALARGIPVLHLNSNFTIDINILEGLDFAPSAGSPSEVRMRAMQLLGSGEIPVGRVREVIAELFAPVNNDYIRFLLSGGH